LSGEDTVAWAMLPLEAKAVAGSKDLARATVRVTVKATVSSLGMVVVHQGTSKATASSNMEVLVAAFPAVPSKVASKAASRTKAMVSSSSNPLAVLPVRQAGTLQFLVEVHLST
ncbi:hypothetical protein BG004_001662, partial [Podila humilis]